MTKFIDFEDLTPEQRVELHRAYEPAQMKAMRGPMLYVRELLSAQDSIGLYLFIDCMSAYCKAAIDKLDSITPEDRTDTPMCDVAAGTWRSEKIGKA